MVKWQISISDGTALMVSAVQQTRLGTKGLTLLFGEFTHSPNIEPVQGASGATILSVPAAGPERQSGPKPPERHPIPEVYTLETTGLLVIAALILILTLIRYWHYIPWSAR